MFLPSLYRSLGLAEVTALSCFISFVWLACSYYPETNCLHLCACLWFLTLEMLKDLRRIHWEHDDIIKWKHFPHCWPFVWGIHQSQVNSLHQGQWCGALMFSLICASINGWINNHEAGDLRHHRSRHDFTVMFSWWWYCFIIIVFIKGIHSVPVSGFLLQMASNVKLWCFLYFRSR